MRLNGGSGIFFPAALCVKIIVRQFGIPFASAMSILQLLGSAKTQGTDTVDLTSSNAATSLKVAAPVPDTNCYLEILEPQTLHLETLHA